MQNGSFTAQSDSHRFKEVIERIKTGRFDETIELLMRSAAPEAADTEREQLLAVMLSWKGKMEAASKMEQYTQSEFLITQWDEFVRTQAAPGLADRYFYALKHHVYHRALAGFLELYNLSGINDPIILAQMGKIYKGLGDFERAIESLELASAQAKSDPRIMYPLADCYAAVDEIKRSKLYFREAFFIDPFAFEPWNCEAQFITDIMARIRTAGVEEADLPCWIPVYAVLLGVFSVKRELKPVEIGRLSQSIHELEQGFSREKTDRRKALLLNRYFWLADHYLTIKAPQEDMEELLVKIRRVDYDIYERYTQ